MIEIHAHILPGIDDGPKDLETAKLLLMKVAESGVDTIIATNHYDPDVYTYSMDEYNEKLAYMQDWCKRENLKLDLYPGNELMLTQQNVRDAIDGKCNRLGNSNYLLVELPSVLRPEEADELMYMLSVRSKIVLAHAERLPFIDKDFDLVRDWYDRGYLFQLNAGNLLNKKKGLTYKHAHKLLKNGMVHVIASDMHSMLRRPPMLREAYAYFTDNYSEEAARLLTRRNPLKIINGELDILSLKEANMKRKRVLNPFKKNIYVKGDMNGRGISRNRPIGVDRSRS